MEKQNYSTTIAIDAERSVIHFYSMIDNDKSTITHYVKGYVGGKLDEHFFNRFREVVKEFAEDTPSETVRKVTVILPDNAVLTDIIRIPTMKGFGQTKKTLDITLGGLYKNYKELHVASHIAKQNKQYTTYAIAAVQKEIATAIYGACSENKLLVDTLTFASSASISGAIALNSKLKNTSYLFLDVKDVYSRFVFVANGRAVGFYTLPFGLEFLRKQKVKQEDMLFDHSYAELTVLNAREKAKSKKLTVMALGGEFSDVVMDIEDEFEDFAEDMENTEQVADEETVEIDKEIIAEEESESEVEEIIPLRPQVNQKIFTRKAPRRLPKFMQREIPETKEGILYENFRIFVKWALTLIEGNKKITELGKPDFVYVNLPDDLEGVVDMVNEHVEENEIAFINLQSAEEELEILSNLELYGGLFPKQVTVTGKF